MPQDVEATAPYMQQTSFITTSPRRESMRSNTRKGFTLIELLIVVVIIGILAAIAIPKFSSTKEKAYLASMKSDLRNLATAEEGYFADFTTYAAGTGSNLAGTATTLPGTGFVPSAGVTVVAAATGGTGWSATAGPSSTTKSCAIFINVAAVAPATVDGEPKCTP
jgi:prepilin-type N-terminal cleavage/methylation domain-containing protein